MERGGSRKRDAKDKKKKKSYTTEQDLQCDEKESSIYNESRKSDLSELRARAVQKIKRKKSWTNVVYD
jgi:hypothetical protein